MLVQAQRKLTSRIKAYGGLAPPQPHFQQALTEAGETVTSKNYMNTQLKIQMDLTNLEPIDMGGRIDPEGHDVYGGRCGHFDMGFTLSLICTMI